MRRLKIWLSALVPLLVACRAWAAPFAYVANFDTPSATGTVTVIDIATDAVVGSIPLPTGHAGRIALNPLGTRVYVAHADMAINQVSVLDASTQSFAGHVQGVGSVPSDVVVSPDGSRAYVTNRYDDTIGVIDTATNQVIVTIPLGSGASPGNPIYLPLHVAVSPDGLRLYVTNHWAFTVSVINTASNAVVATIPVGHYPVGVAFAPSGARAYVANFTDGSVSVIDTASQTVIDVITFTQGDAIDVAVSPASDRVYVTSRDLGRVNVIDATTNAVLTSVQVGATATGIALDSTGERLYVANFDDDSVSVVDTATYAVHTISGVGNEPVAIAIQSPICQPVIADLGTCQVNLETTQGTLASTIAALSVAETDLQNTQDALVSTAAALSAAESDLAAAVADMDADGVRDTADACAGTAPASSVDQVGCSISQFCSPILTSDGAGRRACKKADWRNDEPAMKGAEADCEIERGAPDQTHACIPAAP